MRQAKVASSASKAHETHRSLRNNRSGTRTCIRVPIWVASPSAEAILQGRLTSASLYAR